MKALSDLITEVRFRERMRGYDYEEVDNYVKTVSRVAAQARDHIADLQQSLAHSDATNATDDDGVRETREMLLRTLVLAQRTADAAVAEARAEAKAISQSAQERAAKTVAEAEAAANARLRSSEERAAHNLAEAEENCKVILAEAKRTAATELAAERGRAQQEIRVLEAARDELETTLELIQARLENERAQLRNLSVSFRSFVEQFEPVADTGAAAEPAADATTEAPAAGNVSEAASDAESGGATGLSDASGTHAAEADAQPPAESALHFLPEPEGDALAADMIPDIPDVPTVQWDDTVADTGPGEGEESGDASAEAGGPLAEGGNGSMVQPPSNSLNGGDSAPPAAPAVPQTRADGPELFDVEAEDEDDDDEFIEQLRRVVSGDAPLPDTDAAMAAFFEHDERAGPGRGAAGRASRLGPRA